MQDNSDISKKNSNSEECDFQIVNVEDLNKGNDNLPLLKGIASFPLFDHLSNIQREPDLILDIIKESSILYENNILINTQIRNLLSNSQLRKCKEPGKEIPDIIPVTDGSSYLQSTKKKKVHMNDSTINHSNIILEKKISKNHLRSNEEKNSFEKIEFWGNENIKKIEYPPWLDFIGYSINNVEKTRSYINPQFLSKQKILEQHSNSDFFKFLHEEICALLHWLEPKAEELLIRQRLIARITVVAHLLWPQCLVKLFGSFFTNLWLPNSDIDICLLNVKGDQLKNLRELSLALAKFGIALAIEIISSARVPIVKYIDRESGIYVDVSLHTESALKTTDYIISKMNEYPWIRPLLIILKLYLQQKNLGETYHGGVGSYLLFVLCLSFIQNHRFLKNKKYQSNIGLGHLLLDFLQLYGCDFNYNTTGITVRNGGKYFSKIERGWFDLHRPWLLSVESPLDSEIDLSRNSYEILVVRDCFRQSFLIFIELLQNWSYPIKKFKSILEHVLFMDNPLFLHRKKNEEYFKSISYIKDSAWWHEVKDYFFLPVGIPRPTIVLPQIVLEQVSYEMSHQIEEIVSD